MIGLNKYHYRPCIRWSMNTRVLVVVCFLFVVTAGIPTFGRGVHVRDSGTTPQPTLKKTTGPGGRILVKG